MNKITRIFQPTLVVPKNAVVKNQDITSKSQRLMLEMGLIKHAGNGTFYILPTLQRSLEKCINIVDMNMRKIQAQKLICPTLTSAELWKKSGRLESTGSELMTTIDRHGKKQILSPTHEESITTLMASISPISYRQFPIRLYQITTKFRDEMKPRYGLIRAKEFLMKDLYTFDLSLDDARKTYDEVNKTYGDIFNTIGIPFTKVTGDSGLMGGSVSHEFHYKTSIGDDELLQCLKCNMSFNKEICTTEICCPGCKTSTLQHAQGIEVGHTFILEDKYSKVLGATYLNQSGKPTPLIMGCYGIGITRLISASIEYLSSETEIRWPFLLAPYKICIIPPKDGSKEYETAKHWEEKIYKHLNSIKALEDSIIIDNRTNLTIGKRLMDAKKMGYPLIIVIGSKAAEVEEKFEFHILNLRLTSELSFNDLINECLNFVN